MGSGTCGDPGTVSDQWDFVYDGDGSRVQQVYDDGTSTLTTAYFMGGLYEVTDGAVRKYYSIAGQRVAMNDGDGLKYLLTDHLGSVVAVLSESGTLLSEQRYMPFGEVRTDIGTISQTDFGYTGQRSISMLSIMDYIARFYDPGIGRFLQPDSIVPSPANPQSWNRYSYVLNNPVRYSDPSGHSWEDCNKKMNGYQCRIHRRQVHRLMAEWERNASLETLNSDDGGKPPIVARDDWDALPPGNNPNSSEGLYPINPLGYAYYSELVPGVTLADILYTIVIHHEGNWQTYSVLAVQMNQMQDGYYDIAYHFIIGRDGTIYEGRDINVRGAHVIGGNTGKIGVLWLGDFEPGWVFDNGFRLPFDFNHDDQPTAGQIFSTIWMITWLDSLYGIDRVAGHNEFDDTECPGDYAIPYIPMFNNWLGGQ